MRTFNILFVFSLIFGVIAITLWITRFFIDIDIRHPLIFLAMQLILLIMMKIFKP